MEHVYDELSPEEEAAAAEAVSDDTERAPGPASPDERDANDFSSARLTDTAEEGDEEAEEAADDTDEGEDEDIDGEGGVEEGEEESDT